MHGKSSRVPDACGVDCESGKGRSFVLNVFKRRSSIGKKKKKEKRGKKKKCLMRLKAQFFFLKFFFFFPLPRVGGLFVFVDIKCLERK